MFRHYICNQLFAPAFFLPHHHRRSLHPFMLIQDRFDFPQFNSKTTNLYLMVDSPQKLNGSIRLELGAVSRFIQSRTRFLTIGMRDEFLRR